MPVDSDFEIESIPLSSFNDSDFTVDEEATKKSLQSISKTPPQSTSETPGNIGVTEAAVRGIARPLYNLAVYGNPVVTPEMQKQQLEASPADVIPPQENLELELARQALGMANLKNIGLATGLGAGSDALKALLAGYFTKSGAEALGSGLGTLSAPGGLTPTERTGAIVQSALGALGTLTPAAVHMESVARAPKTEPVPVPERPGEIPIPEPTAKGEPSAKVQVKETGGIPAVEGQPVERVTEEQAKAGTPQRGGEGQAKESTLLLKPAEDFSKSSGVTFDGEDLGGIQIPSNLKDLPPDEQAAYQKLIDKNSSLAFTDRRPGSPTEGVTFYAKKGATEADIQKAWDDKKKEFEGTKTKGTQPTENVPPVVRDVPPGSVPAEGIVPAIRLIGGEVVSGKLGDTHPDIIKREGIKAEDIDQRGFSDPTGKQFFLDREAAAKGTQLPTEREPGRLHSTDLTKAAAEPGAGATPPAPPAPPATSDLMDEASHPEFRKSLPSRIVQAWRSFSMQSLPKITASNRESGEAGVRMASAAPVAAMKGEMFAKDVLQSKDPKFDLKFGTALTEDNLRSVRAGHEAEGSTEAANKVPSLIGKKNSPFKTEQEYQDFLKSPEFQAAVERHKAKWESEKDPLYRQANDLDPDVELPTRGLQTGARVNLKAVMPGEGGETTVGPDHRRSGLIRQASTVKRLNPFSKRATGGGQSYEGSYTEIMKNGFGREYPVAKQHQFIKSLIDAGDAVLTDKEFPDIQVKGEGTKGYLMRLGPFRNRWLQVRKSLAQEYQAASGLDPSASLGLYTKAADWLTRQSVAGLAEGSTHVSNLVSQVFTGIGPTGRPLLNALIKNTGRADIIYSLPKILINAFRDRRADMLHLAEIGAGKTPFPGSGKLNLGMNWIITKVDKGTRLYARDVYKKMAANGIVPDTETGLREFVNQVGQYNKKLQPGWIRTLRDTGIQPFATAMQTFNVQGLRTLGLGPGAKGTGKLAALALRAEKASNLIGFAVLVGTVNYLVSGTSTGPKGTKLGAVGWIGDDGKLHQFDLGALTGISRGARITGIQPTIEAARLGLTDKEALASGVQGAGNTLLSSAMGPMNRAIFTALTGKRAGLPPVQEAPVVPPGKSQVMANVLQSAQQVNPLVDAAARVIQGKPGEAVTRQLSRYTPKTGLSTETIEALPKITQTSQVNAYADALAKEAHKIPMKERGKWIMDRLKEDGLTPEMKGRAMLELRRKGAWSYK